ncbi:hypothetical protein [Lewinella sp. W8]|uniref:hypothetical protein n=1 Tax=Lewinella sp. W8 TaxID=2528208 RepID=UPI001068C364|nr:hypothetical protein [Lewinella sp. W8]MTB53073.1 hypothetical protein [Lewinella sp. W8]
MFIPKIPIWKHIFAVKCDFMALDFTRYDEYDTQQVTIWIYHFVEKLKKDFEAQKRSFKLEPETQRVADKVSLSNKWAMKRGFLVGRKIIQKKELKIGDSFVRGIDFAKTAHFYLTQPGQWKNIEEYLRSIDDKFSELVELSKTEKENNNSVLFQAQKKLETASRQDANAILRAVQEVQSMVLPLVEENHSLREQNTTQQMTILRLTKDVTRRVDQNEKLKASVSRFKKSMDKLLERIGKEKDQSKIEEMRKKYNKMLEEFEKLME